MGQFAVIGLGAFGSNVAKQLFANNHDVLAIDKNREVIEKIEHNCSQAILADATDREVLQALGLENIDAGIVCIGDSIASNTLATLHLKEFNVKRIIVKAISPDHAKILEKIGITEIVYPEKEMAEKLAGKLGFPNLVEMLPFGEKFSVAELVASSVFWGKTLAEANIRAKYGVGVIAIKPSSRENQVMIAPRAEYRIGETDVLMIIGENSDIDRFKAL